MNPYKSGRFWWFYTYGRYIIGPYPTKESADIGLKLYYSYLNSNNKNDIIIK